MVEQDIKVTISILDSMEQINQKDKQGLRHGVWERYHSGTLKWRRNFHHGKRHGVLEDYYHNGTVTCRAHYHHGALKSLEKWYNPQEIPTHKTYHLIIK